VAELADALDSGFHFWRFQGVSSRFKESDNTIDFIGQTSNPQGAARRFTGEGGLSQKVSQSVAGHFDEFPR